MGAHYPSDVLAGMAVAVVTTRLLHASFTRRGWLAARDGVMVAHREIRQQS
ncbi:hypothetical protein [Azospirillum sp. B4]|uniref:hypothetical protein n=1 Tax=Azospirillum sp. B4 TaxID=95605 RepID=UPI0035E3EEA3